MFSGPWSVPRHLSKTALQNIEQAIKKNENMHSGEIRFVVEADLHPLEIFKGKLPRTRAIELFSQLHIWDTAQDNGVLIYLLLADHDVEIVADRGIHHHVGTQGWESICKQMEAEFRRGEFESGVLLGIEQIGAALKQHFPVSAKKENELPDKPLVI